MRITWSLCILLLNVILLLSLMACGSANAVPSQVPQAPLRPTAPEPPPAPSTATPTPTPSPTLTPTRPALPPTPATEGAAWRSFTNANQVRALAFDPQGTL